MGTKVVVILLVVIVVVFIVLVVWGSSTNASIKTTNDSKRDAHDFNSQPHSTMSAIDDVLAPFGPKLALTQKTFDLSRTNPPSSFGVTVPADKDHKFRTAKFSLTATSATGCAQIEYKAQDGDGDQLNDQKWPQKDDTNLRQVSFTILQAGGNITFTRISQLQPCIVQLE